jgi:hypothetical protein
MRNSVTHRATVRDDDANKPPAVVLVKELSATVGAPLLGRQVGAPARADSTASVSRPAARCLVRPQPVLP